MCSDPPPPPRVPSPLQLAVPDWDAPMAITGYMSRLPPPPEPAQLMRVIEAIKV